MARMTRHRVRHLPVVESGKLCGIVSIGDVVKHRLDELELEANILRENLMASH
jgi:CBS domain-containing protein